MHLLYIVDFRSNIINEFNHAVKLQYLKLMSTRSNVIVDRAVMLHLDRQLSFWQLLQLGSVHAVQMFRTWMLLHTYARLWGIQIKVLTWMNLNLYWKWSLVVYRWWMSMGNFTSWLGGTWLHHGANSNWVTFSYLTRWWPRSLWVFGPVCSKWCTSGRDERVVAWVGSRKYTPYSSWIVNDFVTYIVLLDIAD